MTIYWTSEDCDGQAILTLHLSVGQVILFPYFDHWTRLLSNLIVLLGHSDRIYENFGATDCIILHCIAHW